MPAIAAISDSSAPSSNPSARRSLSFGIFIAAAAARLVVAWLFLGSVDIVNDTLDSARLADGDLLSPHVPYLPGIHLLLWLGGNLAARTGLPVAFCYKLFPCLFDSLIAVVCGLASPRRGWIYALAPVPIIVMGLHGQWDGVFLYFLILSLFLLRLGTRAGDALAGVAFVLSVIAKPVSAPLLPFLFPAPWLWRGNERRVLTLIGAMAGTTGAYLLFLAAMHSPLGGDEVLGIFAYAQHGVQLMGLRMISDFDPPRTIGLLSLLILLPAHWTGRLTAERAILLFFAFTLGFCGSAPQYLCWIVPFAILAGDLRFAAIYNFLCATVLLLYYHNPGIGGRNIENLGTYAPLRAFRSLAPSLTNLPEKFFVVFYGGNLIIPLLAIGFFTLVLLRVFRRDAPRVAETIPTPDHRRAIAATLLLVAIALGGLCLWARLQSPLTGAELTQRIRARIDVDYWAVRFAESNPLNPEAPVWVLPSFVGPLPARAMNAFTIGMTWTLLWTAAAYALARRESQRGTADA